MSRIVESPAKTADDDAPLELVAACALISLMTVLYAETNPCTALDAAEVSAETPTLIVSLGAALCRFSVIPGIVVTVFDALSTGTPSTVNEASTPATAFVIVRPVVLPVTEMSLAAPLELATIARREPPASVTTVAVIPAFALLMSCARLVNVLAVPLAGIVTADPDPTLSVIVPAVKVVEPLASSLE